MSARAKLKLRQLQSVLRALAKAGDFFSGPDVDAGRHPTGPEDTGPEDGVQHEQSDPTEVFPVQEGRAHPPTL